MAVVAARASVMLGAPLLVTIDGTHAEDCRSGVVAVAPVCAAESCEGEATAPWRLDEGGRAVVDLAPPAAEQWNVGVHAERCWAPDVRVGPENGDQPVALRLWRSAVVTGRLRFPEEEKSPRSVSVRIESSSDAVPATNVQCPSRTAGSAARLRRRCWICASPLKDGRRGTCGASILVPMRRWIVSGPSGEFEIALPHDAGALELIILPPAMPIKLLTVPVHAEMDPNLEIVVGGPSATLEVAMSPSPPFPYIRRDGRAVSAISLQYPFNWTTAPHQLRPWGMVLTLEAGTYAVCSNTGANCKTVSLMPGTIERIDGTELLQ